MNWFLKDLKSGRTINLKNGDTLGRSQGSHNFPEVIKMSRSHCQFVISADKVFILDLNSTNGTYVNKEKIAPSLKTEIKEGCGIRIGDATFILEKLEKTAAQVVEKEERSQLTEIKKIHPIRTMSATSPSRSISLPRKLEESKNIFNFDGDKTELIILLLKNALFTLLTLGLYFSYAKTNMRKYLWRSTSLNKSSFVFNGNPRQLMKANLILMGIFVVSAIIIKFTSTLLIKIHPFLSLLPSLLYAALITFLVIKARYNGFAYLLNNTTYRSIRFFVNRKGSSEYMKKTLTGSILTAATLGLYYPFMQYDLEKIKWDNSYFGLSKFSFDDSRKKEYAMLCYKNIFLTLITFGLYGSWAMTALHRFKVSLLTIEGAKFESTVNGMGFLGMQLKCMLLIIVTLGLAAPFVLNMTLAYYVNNLSLNGAIGFDKIIQTAKDSKNGTLGDAVLDIFDEGVMDIA